MPGPAILTLPALWKAILAGGAALAGGYTIKEGLKDTDLEFPKPAISELDLFRTTWKANKLIRDAERAEAINEARKALYEKAQRNYPGLNPVAGAGMLSTFANDATAVRPTMGIDAVPGFASQRVLKAEEASEGGSENATESGTSGGGTAGGEDPDKKDSNKLNGWDSFKRDLNKGWKKTKPWIVYPSLVSAGWFMRDCTGKKLGEGEDVLEYAPYPVEEGTNSSNNSNNNSSDWDPFDGPSIYR